MRARVLMRHRATIERNTPVSDSGGGSTSSWANIAVTPCHAWVQTSSAQSSYIAVSGDRPGVLATRLVIVPIGTNIKVGDRLQNIQNKRGRVLFDGPMIVDDVGERKDHLSLITRKIV